MKKQNVLSTVLICLLSALPGIAPRAEQVFEEIIVRVNNDIITKSDYEKTRDLIRRELQKNLKGPELEKAVAEQEKGLLKTMIEDQLMVQKAADLSLSADTEVIKYLDRIRRDQNIADMETLEKMMVQQGIDPVEFKQNIKNQSLKQQLLGREVYSRVQISTEEISKYYEAHKQEFDRPEEVRIREILVSTDKKSLPKFRHRKRKLRKFYRRLEAARSLTSSPSRTRMAAGQRRR